jgi:hypothetical protein
MKKGGELWNALNLKLSIHLKYQGPDKIERWTDYGPTQSFTFHISPNIALCTWIVNNLYTCVSEVT